LNLRTSGFAKRRNKAIAPYDPHFASFLESADFARSRQAIVRANTDGRRYSKGGNRHVCAHLSEMAGTKRAFTPDFAGYGPAMTISDAPRTRK